MRTIKFRGKDFAGVWWYGHLSSHEGYPIIHPMKCIGASILVEDGTVGEFTGLQDVNGADVYEGDILRYPQNNKTYQVVFKDGIFWGEGNNGSGASAHFFPSCEIVGNVFDNPELLEKGGKHE